MSKKSQLELLQAAPQEYVRSGFGEALCALGESNPKVVALCADLTESIRVDSFAEKYPDRFFEMGVAEQNMMGIAAGMALTGKIPFVASYAVFNPGRNWDQLRVSVAYSRANVKIIGAHAGVSVGPDGATHQALEDIAMIRVLPEMVIVVPTDYEEAKKATRVIAAYQGPVYMRFGRSKVPSITTVSSSFTIGKANILRKGKDITILANGVLVYEALLAAEHLQQKNIDVEVIVVHTVKPLDEETILFSVRKTGAVITAEEAQVSGGLGGAVAELLGEKYPVPMKRIGIMDHFGASGTADELMDAYGLRAINIQKAVGEVIKRKKR